MCVSCFTYPLRCTLQIPNAFACPLVCDAFDRCSRARLARASQRSISKATAADDDDDDNAAPLSSCRGDDDDDNAMGLMRMVSETNAFERALIVWLTIFAPAEGGSTISFNWNLLCLATPFLIFKF